jgi:hypothetical protein
VSEVIVAEVELPLENNRNERNLLDQLLTESKLYTTSKEYQELLDFTVRLRNVAAGTTGSRLNI